MKLEQEAGERTLHISKVDSSFERLVIPIKAIELEIMETPHIYLESMIRGLRAVKTKEEILKLIDWEVTKQEQQELEEVVLDGIER